jgi:hypothetical protein
VHELQGVLSGTSTAASAARGGGGRGGPVPAVGLLELRGPLDGEVGRLGALEDPVYKRRGATEVVNDVHSTGHQPPEVHAGTIGRVNPLRASVSSSSTRRAMLAPQSHTIQTVAANLAMRAGIQSSLRRSNTS